MTEGMQGTFGNLVANYGYVFLVVIVGLESLGIPLPGETALVTAGALAAVGRLNIYGVIAAAAAGAIIGDNAGYWIGRKGGLALVQRYGRIAGLSEARLQRVHAFFERHGAKTVFIGRFVALLRSWAAALAGVGQMPYGTFTLYNALGGIVWAAVYGSLGYLFGRNLPLLERYMGQASLAAVLLIALVVAIALAGRWFRRNRTALVEWASRLWPRLGAIPAVAAMRARHPRLWQFLSARFAREEYLGLHLTIGLVVSVAALWLFGGVTEDVIHHDPLTRFDLSLADWTHAHATPVGYSVARALSILGSPAVLAVPAVVVAVILVARRQWIVLLGWVAAFAGGSVLNWALKRIIQRPRPLYGAAFLHGESFSFPSGHVLGSLIGYGMLAYVIVTLWAERRRTKALVITAAAVLVVAIGLSRLYLGVHYFSDVVGGFAAGTVWLAACISGLEIARRHRQPRSGERATGALPNASPRPA
jgi:undecaprenyl-diphosphatase